MTAAICWRPGQRWPGQRRYRWPAAPASRDEARQAVRPRPDRPGRERPCRRRPPKSAWPAFWITQLSTHNFVFDLKSDDDEEEDGHQPLDPVRDRFLKLQGADLHDVSALQPAEIKVSPWRIGQDEGRQRGQAQKDPHSGFGLEEVQRRLAGHKDVRKGCSDVGRQGSELVLARQSRSPGSKDCCDDRLSTVIGPGSPTSRQRQPGPVGRSGQRCGQSTQA